MVVLDTQSVYVAAGVPASTTGLGPANGGRKQGAGRGRGVRPNHRRVLGEHDNAACIALLDQVAGHTGGTIEKALVDRSLAREQKRHQHYRHPQLVPKAGAGPPAVGCRVLQRPERVGTAGALLWPHVGWQPRRPRSLRLVVHPFYVLCRLAAERRVVHVAGGPPGRLVPRVSPRSVRPDRPGRSPRTVPRAARRLPCGHFRRSPRLPPPGLGGVRPPGPPLRCGALRQRRPSCCWTRSRTPDRHADAGHRSSRRHDRSSRRA